MLIHNKLLGIELKGLGHVSFPIIKPFPLNKNPVFLWVDLPKDE